MKKMIEKKYCDACENSEATTYCHTCSILLCDGCAVDVNVGEVIHWTWCKKHALDMYKHARLKEMITPKTEEK